ncbi:hypothetical protein HK102_005044, partial [Quaeritorhiza haematococci]
MSNLMETQAFAQFTLDRIERHESDFEVLFFDESIKAKLNRSKLRLSKETTPFLKDTSYHINQTIAAIPVNVEGLDAEQLRQRGESVPQHLPSELDKSLLVPPRPVPPLITQTDQRMMRSHTYELVQRARMQSNMRRKHDFSKWMKTKWKHFQKIGGGEVVSIGFLSDEQRREMFEARLQQVSDVIDRYEGAHLSSQSRDEVKAALQDLHAQHLILMHAADEEQLVDSSDQEDLQLIYNRLFRVITIYEDHESTFSSHPHSHPHPTLPLVPPNSASVSQNPSSTSLPPSQAPPPKNETVIPTVGNVQQGQVVESVERKEEDGRERIPLSSSPPPESILDAAGKIDACLPDVSQKGEVEDTPSSPPSPSPPPVPPKSFPYVPTPVQNAPQQHTESQTPNQVEQIPPHPQTPDKPASNSDPSLTQSAGDLPDSMDRHQELSERGVQETGHHKETSNNNSPSNDHGRIVRDATTPVRKGSSAGSGNGAEEPSAMLVAAFSPSREEG